MYSEMENKSQSNFEKKCCVYFSVGGRKIIRLSLNSEM